MKPGKTVKPPHLLGAALLLTVFVLVLVIKAFDSPPHHPPGPDTTVVSQSLTPTAGPQGSRSSPDTAADSKATSSPIRISRRSSPTSTDSR